MSATISMVTVIAAFMAALLLVYASFDLPVPSSAAPAQARGNNMSSIREAGLWAAIVALIGAYLVVFLM